MTALVLHPLTAAAIIRGDHEAAAQLHCLAGIRDHDPGWLDRHCHDGRPLWDTIIDLPLSSGEEVLRDAAWELGGNRPQHVGVICRLSWLDDRAYGRVIEAVGIRRGLSVTVADGEEAA